MLTIVLAAVFAAAAYWASARAGRHLTRVRSQNRPRTFAAGWLSLLVVLLIVFAIGWAYESRELVLGVCIGGLVAPMIAKVIELRNRQKN